MKMAVLIFGVVVFSLFSAGTFADAAEWITVETPRGVKQPFLFAAPAAPKASAILFVGSNGDLEGEDDSNFLVRIHKDLVAKGLMVAIVATPSDKDDGIYPHFRISKKHAGDIVRVIKYMNKKADVPVWLVGTSMGTFSAASVAIKKQKLISGLVLTSTITREAKDSTADYKYPQGVLGLNLHKIRKPVLIMSHKDDGCDKTPPADAQKLKDKLKRSPRVEIAILEGGATPASEPCDALSQHGFYGMEDRAMDRIAAFILQ